MAVLKLSQISPSSANIAAPDSLVGLQGGSTDVLFSLAQISAGLSLTAGSGSNLFEYSVSV